MVRRATTITVLVAISVAAACGLPIPPPPVTNGAAAPKRSDLPEGQSAQTFRHEKATDGRIEYLLYLPEGYASAKELFPLVLYLHGSSLRGDDVQLVARYGLPRRLAGERAFPFVVISPQLRADERWTEFAPLAALVDEAVETLPVDPERVYLTGYSMGAGGVWRFANSYPDRFAAAVPLAGTRDDGPIEGLAKVPIWAFHGTVDESTPLGDSESMVSRIREAGGDAKLTVLTGQGHDILEVYDNDAIFTWFLQHRKFAPRKDDHKGERTEPDEQEKRS